MTIDTHFVSHGTCIRRGKFQLFLSYDEPHFSTHLSHMLLIEPQAFRVGSFVIKGFQQLSHTEKFTSMENGFGISCLKLVNLNVLSEELLENFIDGQTWEEGDVVLNDSTELVWASEDKLTPLNSKELTNLIIDISFEYDPPIRTVPGTDPFRFIKTILDDPRNFFLVFRSKFPFESLKSITENKFVQFCAKLKDNFEQFSALVYTAQKVVQVLQIKDSSPFVTHFSNGKIEVYPMICDPLQGSFKHVQPTPALDEELLPKAIVYGMDDVEYAQEITIRQDSYLSSVLKPIDFSTFEVNGLYVTDWAKHGTLLDFLIAAPPIEARLKICVDLLEKMHHFHLKAVHKDLSLRNLIIDETGCEIELFINDLGSYALKDHTQALSTISTNAFNLSPEILEKISAAHDLIWQEALYIEDLDFDSWIKSERFVIGSILFEILTGYNIHQKTLDETAYLAEFGFLDESFETIFTDPSKRMLLDFFLKDYFLLVESVYKIAYKEYRKVHLDEPEIDEELINLINSLRMQEFRLKLEPFIGSNTKALKHTYSIAFKNATDEAHIARRKLLALHIKNFALTKQIVLDNSPEPLKRIIASFADLLNYDKDARPPLDLILSNFLKTLD